jgi:hypothetical protein
MTQQEHGEEDEGKFCVLSCVLLLVNDDLSFFFLLMCLTQNSTKIVYEFLFLVI